MTITRAAAFALLVSSAISQVTQPPPVSEMPLFLSWYDPELCKPENGGVMINCDSDPTRMAGGTAVTADMYGYAAACPAEWFDRVIMIPGVGERRCLDTGGAIKVTYRRTYTSNGFVWGWCVYVDILHQHETPPD